jgi:prevent-host-death family protein
MADRTIPLRELRNDISSILRAVEQEGAAFTITVRGKPVARLAPLGAPQGPRVDVDRETIRRIIEDTPVDPDFAKDIEEAQEWLLPDDNPWPDDRAFP